MSLCIGIHVRKQSEGWGEYGHNPHGNTEELQQSFARFMEHKFPNGGYGYTDVSLGKEDYNFCVGMPSYGSKLKEAGYEMGQIWLAIVEYAFDEFSHLEGVKLETYWSG